MINNTNGGHAAITVELGMLAPVVVIEETTVNSISIGMIVDVK
jgi:hypothetical protein